MPTSNSRQKKKKILQFIYISFLVQLKTRVKVTPTMYLNWTILFIHKIMCIQFNLYSNYSNWRLLLIETKKNDVVWAYNNIIRSGKNHLVRHSIKRKTEEEEEEERK